VSTRKPTPASAAARRRLQDQHQPAARLDHIAELPRPAAILVARKIDIHRESRIQRAEIERLEIALERRQPAGPRVSLDARRDHLLRAVDRHHIGARRQHQSGGDAMPAAHLQHGFTGLRCQQFHRPAMTSRDCRQATPPFVPAQH